MAKEPVCPKHKLPLELHEKDIVVAGSSYTVCIGACPKCTNRYINRQILSCSTLTIEGQKYEYLSCLPGTGELRQKPVAAKTPDREKGCQRMEDIEQFFLSTEKDIHKREVIEHLTKQNESLQTQLDSMRKEITGIENRHQKQLAELQAKYQAQLKEAVRALEKENKVALNKVSEDYQKRIARLNQLHQKSIDEMQQASKTALEAERRRVTSLQQSNASLEKQVTTLSKQLSEVKGPTRQIVFVNDKLYVCGGTIRCEKNNHRREDVTAIIDTIKGTPVTMTVCHCKDCNLYYVRDVVFDSYREKYGTLLGRFVRQANGMNLGQTNLYGELALESMLHMNGYNVNQTDNLSPGERRKILTYVIESHIMDKNDIRNHLSYLVKMNQSNPSKNVAVSRWRSDIQWVNEYQAGMQDTVWLTGTAMYRFRRK